MDPASPYTASGYKPGSPRERLVSSAMSLGIILAVLLAVIFQTVVPPEQPQRQRPTTFNVAADDPNKAARSSQSRPKAPQAATRAAQVDSPRPKPVITVQKQVERPDTPEGIPGFIPLSSAEMAASDIGKMKGPAKGSDNDGKGNDSRTAFGPGEGPGGVRLYDAEWYRRPTDAQLSTYLPNKPGLEGWGLVACRTIADYHVEDCTILGESPRGSGFGRSVQNAAWQFLVRPPRIDNKPQVGEWVRIRITYSTRGAVAR